MNTPPAVSPSSDPAAIERRIGARMIALGLSLRAMDEVPDTRTLALAVIATSEALGPDDPVTRDVAALARIMPQAKAGNAPLAPAGEQLFRTVTRALRGAATPEAGA